VSWLDSDECEHTETLTDGREAHSLIEAILRDENLTLMAYDHKSERKKKLVLQPQTGMRRGCVT